ncbi:MAG: hypothetical protein KGM24_01220 [Elusimicrobia bacterium]|nr:hypothetical protein [Elusimicrobiota bacterium]
MTLRARLAALLVLLAAAAPAAAGPGPMLWQERYFWDALLTARDKLARQQSDPMMIPVMNAIAGQIAQQVANLKQIDAYVKAQSANLRYAYGQPDPQPSLATILGNFKTLTTGADQVRQNLYYLTARERMASSQALQDQGMYKAGLLILGQIQQLQLTLNALYYDTLAVRNLVLQNRWAEDRFFVHEADGLMRAVVYVQDSVFAVYNAGYDLTIRCR